MKALAFMCVLLMVGVVLKAQDPRERYYNYSILKPSHAEKPAVEGQQKQRIEEKLNRGLLAFQTQKGVYISWRLLKSDPDDVAFNIYGLDTNKKTVKINKNPVSETTDFICDRQEGSEIQQYFVRMVVGGTETGSSELATPQSTEEGAFRSLKLKGNYFPDRMAVGDLNGDGEFDYIIKQPGGRVDPGVWRKSEDTFKLEAYLSDGTFLWQIDLGWNIELGIWYSPFIVYDFDGDGKAEVAVKTAPTDQDYRNADGRVFSGPEYCSILNGMTGKEIDRVDWIERSPRLGDYNRNNRNQMGMAYLDGKTPCLLVARGTYRAMLVDAYHMVDGKLKKLWRWDGDEENPVVRSQGAHNLHTVDLDYDGRDEIVLGSAVLDDNGTLLFSAGVGHSDKCFITDIVPDRPGMEIFYANEVWHDSLGIGLVDAKSGEPIWNIGQYTRHIGNGMVADILPQYPGLECFGEEDPKADLNEKYLFTASGKLIGHNDQVPPCTNWVFWDGDRLRESLTFSGQGRGIRRFNDFGYSVVKYQGDTLSTGIKGMVMIIGDLYGDWREEVVMALPGELRIYTSTFKANDRRVCLMQDPLYRSDVVHRSMGYPQAPVTTYYIGE